MILVAVSGAAGRMGTLVARTVAAADDLELHALYDPHHDGIEVAGVGVAEDPDALAGADVVVEFTHPDVVMGNLARWRTLGCHAVVGTSGFDAARVAELRAAWGDGPPNCLVAPNFSIGAVTMMHLSEIAASQFSAAEVIELHHDHKADAPSGTALETARKIAGAAPHQERAVESTELVEGTRGGRVDDVRVHSVRLPGLVAHQEVIFGGPGETLSIRHDTIDRGAFMPGVLLGIRSVGNLEEAVTIGLEGILDL